MGILERDMVLDEDVMQEDDQVEFIEGLGLKLLQYGDVCFEAESGSIGMSRGLAKF